MVDFDNRQQKNITQSTTAPRSTSATKLPLEVTLTDPNMILIDEHKNARGNEVLKFRNRVTGETRTYPNVNPSHLPSNLKDKINQGAVGVDSGGSSTTTTSTSTLGSLPPPDSSVIPPEMEIEGIFPTSLSNMDVRDGLQYLINDHNSLKEMFKQYDMMMMNNDNDGKRRIVYQIIQEVSMHASIEEQLVYPLMRQFLPNGEDIANKNLTDDQCNKLMMTQIQMMDPQHDGKLYDDTVRNFFSNELNHISQEEEYLADLRMRLSADVLAELFDSLVLAKSTAPTHPHPEAPNRPEFGANEIHPLLGQLDRMSDNMIMDSLNPTNNM